MSEQEKLTEPEKLEDVIVVAQDGYSVLLDIDKDTLAINCHESVNLSNRYTAEVILKCSSLATHLKAGNLVRCTEDAEFSVDAAAPVTVPQLKLESASHILSQYDQASRDSTRTHTELETQANITAATRKNIQEQVNSSRLAIQATDNKFLNKRTAAAKVEAEMDVTPKMRETSMDSSELLLKVSMDISPEAFTEKQQQDRERLEAAEDANEAVAQKEIAKQEAAEAAERG